MSKVYALSDFQRLLQLNFRAAIAHFVVMVAFLVYFWIKLKPQFQLASTYRLEAEPFDPNTTPRTLDYPLRLKKLFQFNVPWLLLTFFAVTVFAHIFYATDGFGSGLYYKLVMQGWNPVRWIEYGISASIMILILCILNGVRDLNAWVPIVVAMAVIQGQGYIVERELIKAKPDFGTVTAATLFGWVLLVVSFFVQVYALTNLIIDSRRFDARVPTWVPLLTAVQLFNFALFGVNQLRHISHIKHGMGVDSFIGTERGYVWLSFFAKLVLAGFLSYGLIDWQNKVEAGNP